MQNYIIRRLKVLDILVLMSLFKDISIEKNNFFKPHKFTSRVAINICQNCEWQEDIYYVIEEDKSFIGYGFLRGFDDGFIIPMLGIYLLPSARGKGLAKVFMNYIIKDCPTKTIQLHVDRNNFMALNLYKNLGFKVINTNINSYTMEYIKND